MPRVNMLCISFLFGPQEHFQPSGAHARAGWVTPGSQGFVGLIIYLRLREWASAAEAGPDEVVANAPSWAPSPWHRLQHQRRWGQRPRRTFD